MSDKDGQESGQDNGGPTLELPSLGFGGFRWRRRGESEDTEADPGTGQPDRADQPVDTTDEPAPEPEPEAEVEAAAGAESEPEPESGPEPEPEADAEPEPEVGAEAEPEVEAGATTEQAATGGMRFDLRSFYPTGPVAAAVAGGIVGAVAVILTWLAGFGCDLALGTSNCGDPGFFLLVVIGVVLVAAGTRLLRGMGIAEAATISFLGVAVLAILTMLFFVDLTDQWWVILVIPAASVLCFVVAHWVATTFAGGADIDEDGHLR